MKDKPKRHTVSNVFHFKRFHAKLKELKVSSREFILKKDDQDDLQHTFFWRAILKNREVNLTHGFKIFQERIGDEVQSIAQLLLSQMRVFEELEETIRSADTLELPPLLELVTAFARDLPEPFYRNYFYQICSTFVIKLKGQCHESVEGIFVCYVSLFTILQRFMQNDIMKLYHENNYSVLFSGAYPWFVNELAAQSLGFIIRKMGSSQREFFVLAFKMLQKDKTLIEGLGRLIFHSVKSDVANRLHSSSSSTLSNVLSIIKEDDSNEMALKSVLFSMTQVTNHVTAKSENTTPWYECWKEDSVMFWDIIWNQLESAAENVKFVQCILKIISTILEKKGAILVYDGEKSIRNVLTLMEISTDDETAYLILDIISSIIISPHYDISQKLLSEILYTVFQSDVLLCVTFTFVKNILDFPRFDSEILPTLLEFVQSILIKQGTVPKDEIYELLIQIITTFRPPLKMAEELSDWQRYPLDFSSLFARMKKVPVNTLPYVIRLSLLNGLEKDLSNCEDIILATICMCHVTPLDEKIIDLLQPILSGCFKILLENNVKCATTIVKSENEKSNKLLNEDLNHLNFLISTIVESLHHLMDSDKFISVMIDLNFLDFVLENSNHRENIHILKAVDIFLCTARIKRPKFLTNILQLKIFKLIGSSLTSSNPMVRLLTCSILSYFPMQLPQAAHGFIGKQKNMFEVMYEAEKVPVTQSDYKERLRLISMIAVERIHLVSVPSDDYNHAPLLFLIGQLHVNFKEIWNPVIKYISEYAQSLPEDVFWPLWVSIIRSASEFTMEALSGNEFCEDNLEFVSPILTELEGMLKLHPGFTSLSNKPNYISYRDLLWKAMHFFPEICERRHRDVVPLILNFLKKEFFPIDYNIAPTQDVSNTESSDSRSILNPEVDLNVNSDEEDKDTEVTPEKKRTKKAPIKSLQSHITLIAKFHNPKAMYKCKELEIILKEFLCYPYLPAQKFALDAILAFNYKYLTPYKEILHRILDDSTFKNQLTLFIIDRSGFEDENDGEKILKDSHRAEFMPILMRLLYGKMHCKTGAHSSGKGKLGVRKAIVLRFLAGSRNDEMSTFLDLSFDVLQSHLVGSALDVVERVMNHLDPSSVVPIKRMKGTLSTLENIFSKLGSRLGTKHELILKVMLFILSVATALLQRKAQISSFFIPALKNLRHSSLDILLVFFTHCENYSWSESDIKAVFIAAVWPHLAQLPDEGIYSPTPLMKLFTCWASIPNYQCLLATHHFEDDSISPLAMITRLMNHPKCSKSVLDASYGIIESLIFTNKENYSESVLPIPENYILDVKHELEFDLTFGESLVLKNMDGLMKNLKNILRQLKNGKSLSSRELAILIRMTKWASDKGVSVELLEIIVSLLLKKGCLRSEEKAAYLLETCANLLKIVDDPGKYVQSFITLFLTLKERATKEALISVIGSIASREQKFEQLFEWTTNLNSWNQNRIEEFDFDTRLSCYTEIHRYLETVESIEEEMFLFLIYFCSCSLNEVDDSAIRESSSLCLHNLVSSLSRLQANGVTKLGKRILQKNILPQLKRGIKHVKSNIRDVFFSLFSHTVHKCSDFSPVLKDLAKISDKEDLEVDFFMNLCHIQKHRRARALNRLVDEMKDDKVTFEVETMSEYLLPIVSSFLFKDEYMEDANLIRSCINSIGMLARHLPWPPYLSLLRQYLKVVDVELKYLKVSVKVLVEILEAFHEEVEVYVPDKVTAVSSEELENEDADVDSTISKSQRIYQTLMYRLVPEVQRTFSKCSQRDMEHAVNQKKHPEEEDIKRIPLALAVIKLLKKLPGDSLHRNVNGILMKLVNHLKSKSEPIRKEARNMLVKVLLELGGEYLGELIKDMSLILNRGYQLHVMVFTMHAILVELQKLILPSHLDSCLSDMMEHCVDDIFSDRAEEKEVSKITAKIHEAGASKGYSIMGILAEVISSKQLGRLTEPLFDVLKTHNKMRVNKVAMCFNKICNGLDRNKNLTIEVKSSFVYELLTEKIEELFGSSKFKSKISHSGSDRIDSYLLEPEPKRLKTVSGSFSKVTSHIVVEFSLHLLHTLLKHDKYSSKNEVHISFLDSFVPVMVKCLVSEYPDVTINALHCISLLINYPLPSLQVNLEAICGQMFVLLNKFSSSGTVKDKNFQLVQLTFKTLSFIIKNVGHYQLKAEQARVLICFARENINDFNQYHATFTLLQAIIDKKIKFEELHELMIHVRDLSVLSTNLNMLDQARKSYLHYMLQYPKKRKQHKDAIYFYLKNISYEIPEGRTSAALMISEIVQKYPRILFKKQLEINILLYIGDQLVRESSKEQKNLLQKIMRKLFSKSKRKTELINISLKLLHFDPRKSRVESSALIHKGAQILLSILTSSPEKEMSTIIKSTVTSVITLLNPNFYQTYDPLTKKTIGDSDLSQIDLALNSLLEVFGQLVDTYLTKKNMETWSENVSDNVWNYIAEYLLYPNLQIRITSSILIGKLFASTPVTELSNPCIASDSKSIRGLIMDFCEQFRTECTYRPALLTQLSDLAVKNLIYLVRGCKKIPWEVSKKRKLDEDGNPVELKDSISIEDKPNIENSVVYASKFVLQRVGKLAYEELKVSKNLTTIRLAFLNLIAGILWALGDDFLTAPIIVKFVITHLTREINDANLPETLIERTKEVMEFVKKIVGVETYNMEMMKAKLKLGGKRMQRKARIKEKIFKDPIFAQKIKTKRTKSNALSKKRKIANFKLGGGGKNKLRKMAITS